MGRRLLPCGLLVLLLSGCGGDGAPSLALTCTVHSIPSGLRARVTVTNQTATTQRAIIYGPAIFWLRHISPVLTPQPVVVQTNNGALPFSGYLLGNLRAHGTAHLLMRFVARSNATLLLVTNRARFHDASWQPDSLPHCSIGP